MALVLTEEQQLLRDTATQFFQKNVPIANLRKLRDSKSADGYDPSASASCSNRPVAPWPQARLCPLFCSAAPPCSLRAAPRSVRTFSRPSRRAKSSWRWRLKKPPTTTRRISLPKPKAAAAASASPVKKPSSSMVTSPTSSSSRPAPQARLVTNPASPSSSSMPKPKASPSRAH